MKKISLTFAVCATAAFTISSARAGDAFNMQGVERIAILHAQGAQIYECASAPDGRLIWKFREPVATLLDGNKTIGRHYAGPSWELADGTTLRAKVVAQAPAVTPADIPTLMLSVTHSTGKGAVRATRTILRTNTKGGVASGVCSAAGEMLSVPYTADYEFYDAVRDN